MGWGACEPVIPMGEEAAREAARGWAMAVSVQRWHATSRVRPYNGFHQRTCGGHEDWRHLVRQEGIREHRRRPARRRRPDEAPGPDTRHHAQDHHPH